MDIGNEDEYTLRRCGVDCTGLTPVGLVRTGGGLMDEKLVIGWIRHLFGSSEFQCLELLPLYLMQMIAKWFSEETIHVMQQNGKHNAISLRHIQAHLVTQRADDAL